MIKLKQPQFVQQAIRTFTSFSSYSNQQQFPQVPGITKLRRFYKEVDVVPHPEGADRAPLGKDEPIGLHNLSKVRDGEETWAILLDGRPIKTMYKDSLKLPSRAIAVALAEEWEN